jgi:hypothetical protein
MLVTLAERFINAQFASSVHLQKLCQHSCLVLRNLVQPLEHGFVFALTIHKLQGGSSSRINMRDEPTPIYHKKVLFSLDKIGFENTVVRF